MHLLVLIIGLVLGGYLLFVATIRRRYKKHLLAREEFEQTVLETPKNYARERESVARSANDDPLLEDYSEKAQVPKNPFLEPKALPENNVFEKAIPTAPTPSNLFEKVMSVAPAAFKPTPKPVPAPRSEASTPLAPPEIMAFTILPRQQHHFTGDVLLASLKINYFYFGKQKIFHRHIGDQPSEPILFSVASLKEPGTFDPAHMSRKTFSGVVMFMTLPSVADPLVIFEKMLTSARQLAASMNGELCDMQRKPLAITTITSLRERIQNDHVVPVVQNTEGLSG